MPKWWRKKSREITPKDPTEESPTVASTSSDATIDVDDLPTSPSLEEIIHRRRSSSLAVRTDMRTGQRIQGSVHMERIIPPVTMLVNKNDTVARLRRSLAKFDSIDEDPK